MICLSLERHRQLRKTVRSEDEVGSDCMLAMESLTVFMYILLSTSGDVRLEDVLSSLSGLLRQTFVKGERGYLTRLLAPYRATHVEEMSNSRSRAAQNA